MARCLDALAPDAREAGAEVIVADGSSIAAPPGHYGPEVVWRSLPGRGVFDLRLEGIQAARGRIVAITEDHCVVAPGWCAAVVAAHERLPGARAIKGQVTNGSRAHLVDRAAYLMNQVPHIPPLTQGMFADVFGISCTSFQRTAIDALHGQMGPTVPELAGRAAFSGADVAGDERVRVEHIQSEGWAGTAALQFHNGRAVSGMTRGKPTARDWLRLLTVPILPWARAARTIVACWGKAVPRREILASAPVFVLLFYAKGVGEAAGYLLGPGDSARRLQ